MKRLSALLLVLALFAVACGDDDAADAGGDGEGPRIVSLSPTATEILFAIGAGEDVVAVDQFSYYPDEAPVTDLDGFAPNVEAVADFEPDLVVMQSNADVQAGLEALGIEVIVQDAAASIPDTYSQIEALGASTGRVGDAAELVSEMQSAIDGLIADAPDASGLTYYHELDDTLFSVTSATFVGEIYSLFGLTNVADPADDGSAFGYPQLNDEFLVDADPDLIFLADTKCCGQTADTVGARPGWDQLGAVQAGNIIELDDDIASRWGPRIVEFAEAIAGALAEVPAPA